MRRHAQYIHLIAQNVLLKRRLHLPYKICFCLVRFLLQQFCFTTSTPLRSALAVRLFIELKAGDSIPITLEEQAQWWSTHYHSGGDASSFQEKVEAHESGEFPTA